MWQFHDEKKKRKKKKKVKKRKRKDRVRKIEGGMTRMKIGGKWGQRSMVRYYPCKREGYTVLGVAWAVRVVFG